MAYTELTIIKGLAKIASQAKGFSKESVFVNEWGFFDNPKGGDCFLVFQPAEVWNSVQPRAGEIRSFSIGSLLVTRFIDSASTAPMGWGDALERFSLARDRLLDRFGNITTNARAAGGLSGVSVNEIASAGERLYLDETGATIPADQEGIPVYVAQAVLFEIQYEVC
ncbi:MAG: hypothetical protein GY938_16610 [Ketobacter sp.]|nr:hypothetical protein [Ketobacter sp.]